MTEPPEPRDERFDALYSEYRRPVLAYCMRRLGASDAADAASETFLVAWRRMEELPPPPGTLPYLYAIAGAGVFRTGEHRLRRTRLGGRRLRWDLRSGEYLVVCLLPVDSPSTIEPYFMGETVQGDRHFDQGRFATFVVP